MQASGALLLCEGFDTAASPPTQPESPARQRRSAALTRLDSLEGNRRAGLFKSGLRLVSGFLGRALEHGLGGTVDDGLGLAEAERGELADDLDDLDLLLASGLEHDVERGLLFDLFSGSGASGSRAGNGDRSGRGDLEGLLERLDELRELDEGQALELLEQLFSGQLRHDF